MRRSRLSNALPTAVDADVGERRSGQHAAHGVEGLGTSGLAEDEIAVGRVAVNRGTHVLGDLVEQQRVGIEEAIHVADVASAEAAGEHRRIAIEAISTADARVVGDVARALLEVAHEPAPLEHLGEHVGSLLTGQVHAAELGDGIVAVLEEDLLVQFLGTFEADRGVDGVVAADVEIADELVEEQSPQALGAAAVSGEQRAFDHLRQVDQGKHRAIEVGEVAP